MNLQVLQQLFEIGFNLQIQKRIVLFFVKTPKLRLNLCERICLCFHRFANSADTPLKNFAVGPPPIMMTLRPRPEILDTMDQIMN